MSIPGFLLGVLNIALVIVLLAIVIFAVIFVFAKWVTPIPEQIQKLLWAAVALVGLSMVVSLIFGFGVHPVLLRG